MVRLRPYRTEDADTILSWCGDERIYYQWSAGMLGGYPPTRGGFAFAEALMPFTAFDESGILGFFTLRTPAGSPDELRFGFVILDPAKRGRGYGKAMLQLGLKYAFDIWGARRSTLGVFENNPAAYHCYSAAGFRDVTPDTPETCRILGEVWRCREMAADNPAAVRFPCRSLREAPALKDAAAAWFHGKWGVPEAAYRECMDAYLAGKTEYGWYLCLDGDTIVGGLGVIENDFHDRKDLSPNVCAVYTEEAYRGQGIAGRLLHMAVEELRSRGVSPVYLLTEHTGFYERYGWEFYCMAQGDGESRLSRLYIHR